MTVANDKDPADRLRAICLGLPDVAEKETWEAPTYRVRDKIFAMERRGDGRLSLWCKAPAGSQAILVGADPELFFAPPYVGPKGWIGMRLDRDPDWAEVALLVTRSYWMTAPKRLAARLPEAGCEKTGTAFRDEPASDGRIDRAAFRSAGRQDTIEDGNSPDCTEMLGARPRR